MIRKSNVNYDQEPLLECYKLRFISLYSTILFVISLFFNSILLYILFKHKHLRTTLNIFIMTISILNLIGTLIEFPVLFLTNYKCKWIFGEIGCYLTGTIMYSIASATTFLITAISIERLNVINKPYLVKNLNTKLNVLVIFGCIIMGIFWALLPIFGWSYYSLEGVRTTCSVEWSEQSFNVQSYNITIMIMTFILPLTIILISNLKIIYLLRKTRHNISPKLKWLNKKIKKERRTTITTLFLIAGFIFCWLPYAVVSGIRMVWYDLNFSPLLATLPSLFAKISLPWNAIFYLFSHREIFYKFKMIFSSKSDRNEYKSEASSSNNHKNFNL